MTALRFVPAIVVGLLALVPSCIDWQGSGYERVGGDEAEQPDDADGDDVARPVERSIEWGGERGGAGGVHEPVVVGPHGGAGGDEGPVHLTGGAGGDGEAGSSASSSATAASSSSSAASSSASSGGSAVCAHALCQTGALLDTGCDPCATLICQQDPYCCQSAWDSVCVGEVGSICGAPCTPPTGSCAHGMCTIGGLLQSGCDPCVTAICQQDPYCCQTSWDGQCLNEVQTICGSAACG